MTKHAIQGSRDTAPVRSCLSRKPLRRLTLVGVAALATFALPQADRRAAAQSSMSLVRIHDGGPALYLPFTKTCADALRDTLSGRGIAAQIDSLSSTNEIEALRHDRTIIDIDVLPTGVGALPLPQTPEIASLVENYSPFRDIAHFQAFLYSRLYEAALHEHTDSRDLNDTLLQKLFPKLWIGWAYAGTTQLFSADTPVVRPSDLSGRTLFSEFSSVSLLNLHADLRFGYNADLAHAPTTIAGQRAALSRALEQANRSGIVVAQPLVLGDSIVPDTYKRFVALANWHIMLTSFELRAAWDHADQIENLQHIVRDAALDCSRQNLDTEVTTLGKLKREGSTIVPVDAPAFHALTLQLLKRELDDAVRKEALAKQAWDRKSAEIEASKRKAAEAEKRKQGSAKPPAPKGSAPSGGTPGSDVAELLGQMKGLFDFDDDPTSKEEDAYNDAVRDSERAKQMIAFYNKIQELR